VLNIFSVIFDNRHCAKLEIVIVISSDQCDDAVICFQSGVKMLVLMNSGTQARWTVNENVAHYSVLISITGNHILLI